jgi:hypothetical protein
VGRRANPMGYFKFVFKLLKLDLQRKHDLLGLAIGVEI